MIRNHNQNGRTVRGRYTWRPLMQWEPDDYPPDSRYWQRRFEAARLDLERLLGRHRYSAWAERTWPGDSLARLTWRAIAETAEAAARAAAASAARKTPPGRPSARGDTP